MPAGDGGSDRALVGDGRQRRREADVPGDEIVGRGGVFRAATAPAERHAARHHDHGGHPFDAEQAEQARVDGDTGLRAAEALADPLRGLRQPARADAAQHQRRICRCGIARPLPPARGGHREAGEDQDFRRAGASGCTLDDSSRMAFGRERDAGPPGRSGNRLSRGPAGALQGAVEDRAGPVAEIVAARPCAAPPRPAGLRPRPGSAARDISSARAFPMQPAASNAALRNRTVGACRKRRIGLSSEWKLSLFINGFRVGSRCACATAGSRSSRPRPAAPAASPTAPRTARSGCSRSWARSPAPARSSASGTATSS